jgi:hypothetical protein
MKIDLTKTLAIINPVLMIAVLVVALTNKCDNRYEILTQGQEQRLDSINTQLELLNARKPLENKLIIIDNETIQNISGIDTITSRASVDSIFARFNNVIKPKLP